MIQPQVLLRLPCYDFTPVAYPTFGNRPIKVKVLSDVEPRTKDVAREMYEIIEQDNVLAAAHDAPKAE